MANSETKASVVEPLQQNSENALVAILYLSWVTKISAHLALTE